MTVEKLRMISKEWNIKQQGLKKLKYSFMYRIYKTGAEMQRGT